MPPALFLQSDVQNPYALYETMLAENPVYWNEVNQLWAVYAYKDCASILSNQRAHIPPINQNNKDGLNEYALLITNGLARLSNGMQHTIAREVAMLLFQKIKTVSIGGIAGKLLQDQRNPDQMDFVQSICMQLPVMVMLKSFGFKDEDADFICAKMDQLVKIMLPVKTTEQVKNSNDTAKEIYSITEKHLFASGIHYSIIKAMHKKYTIDPDKIMNAGISNLIGLFIQGYDAGRGVLSNTLLQIMEKDNFRKTDFANKIFIEKSVIETLRFDPPVQNTRRIAAENILINNTEVKMGQPILVVLAAANRDAKQFKHAGTYNIERDNNGEHLTFGAGHHMCVAKQFSVYLATETLFYIFNRYKKVALLEKDIQYEPAVNVRLPKEILIALS
jgi:cytochrome P450